MESKTILVLDDERSIREGIMMVMTEAFPSFQIVSAQSGTEAYKLICSQAIDISITDIMVPEINGLQLIQRCVEEGKKTAFIILSGYGEFAYATQAMQYGVRRYLLKPVDEEELLDSVREAIQEQELQHQRKQYISQIKDELDDLRLRALTEYWSDYMSGGETPEQSSDFYREESKLLNSPFWVVSCNLQQTDPLASQVKRFFRDRSDVLICVMPLGGLTLVVFGCNQQELFVLLDTLSQSVFPHTFAMGVSRMGGITQAQQLYRQSVAAMEQLFYRGKAETIVFEESFWKQSESFEQQELKEMDRFIEKVETRCTKEAEQQIGQLYERLQREKPPVEQAREILERYGLIVSRKKGADGICDAYRLMEKLSKAPTLEQAISTLKLMLERLYMKPEKAMNETIRKMLNCIEEHLHDENFSLGQMAEKALFMNSVYLGRLFKKEMGISFSQYVMLARIESAKAMLENGKGYKVYEISKAVGFGDNPQYFSQIFRKFTGKSPSAYQRCFLEGLHR